VTARGPKPDPLIEFANGDSGVAAALVALPFRGPIDKAFHVVAVLPGEVEKLSGRQIGGFFPEEGLKAPADIGALPRTKSITASGIPVILQRLEHFLRNGRIAQPSSPRL
jgi:hypothetical protein